MKPITLIVLVTFASPALAQNDAPTAEANAEADITIVERDAETPVTADTAPQADATEAHPPTTQPAEAPQAQQAEPAAPEPTEKVLAERVRNLVIPPGERATRADAQRQLADLSDNAYLLYQNSRPGPLRLQALSVQLQAIYTAITDEPHAEGVDQLIKKLRITARRAKTVDDEQAKPTGDFWLMTADLLEIGRTRLPLAERQTQAAQVMGEYLERHGESEAAPEVKAALTELNKARGIADEPEEAETPDEPAPTPAPVEPQAQPEHGHIEQPVR